MERIRASGSKTRMLINSRTDIALAAGADGVHLRSRDVPPDEVRKIWRAAGRSTEPTVAASCHTEAEVVAARRIRGGFCGVRPSVWEERCSVDAGAAGMELLQTVCSRIPVFALGGVTAENAARCLDAGAKGIAGIRLFQESEVAAVVAKLRG